jgi:hypothetical protein
MRHEPNREGANDPRGSGSTETRKPELDELGEVHFGRKSNGPTREELHNPDELRGRTDYVGRIPMKEGLPEQFWPFVHPYDGWPDHKRRGG